MHDQMTKYAIISFDYSICEDNLPNKLYNL